MMATVNFSIPDELKAEFNQLFSGENKSAVLTELIKQAIEQRKARQRRLQAIQAILDLRNSQKPISHDEIQSVRKELRE